MPINPISVSAPAPNDTDLVNASLAGDRGAFGQIVARHQSLICSLAYSATGSLNRSEDLAQETFVTAWQQLPALREPAKLRAWLCGIARNLISNAQRRAVREPADLAEPFDPAHEVIATEPSPPEQAVSREEEAILWRALDKIPETYREPLVLFYREHKSVESVARELELSEDAVKQRLSRGRALLHEQVLAFVEGTLERSNPGRAFTGAVLAALPVMGTGVAAAAAGVSAAKGSTAAKVASSAGGAGLAAAVFGLLGVIGGYVGWQMGDTNSQSSAERTAVARFWRLVVGGFVLFLLPAFVLTWWHRSHPWQLNVAPLWLGLLYVAVGVGFAMYAWQQHRRIRRNEPTAAIIPPPTGKRVILWVALGTFVMAVVFALGTLDSGDWRTKIISPADARALIVARHDAVFVVSEYQNGSRSLSIYLPEDRGPIYLPEKQGRTKSATRLDEATFSVLKQSDVPYRTSVQGRDFEIFGLAGHLLPVLSILIVAAGAVTLARMLKRRASISPMPALKSGAASKSATMLGALFLVLIAGLIFFFSVSGLVAGVLGICLGVAMSRASARSSRQHEHVMRFWRTMAVGTFVVVVPTETLQWTLPTGFLFQHPGLLQRMTYWLELIYPVVGVAVGIWFWRWWRGLTDAETAINEPPRPQRQRFALWFVLGWVLPAGFCGLFLYNTMFQTTLTNRRLSAVEMQKLITERQDAHLRMTQYADGAKWLWVKLPEDGRRIEYWTRVDDATLALLAARKIAYPISVEGRDFIETMAPLDRAAWGWLTLLSCFIAPVGGMLLLRWPGRARLPLPESDPARTERTATRAFVVGLALSLVALAVLFGLVTRWHVRTLAEAEVRQIVTAHRDARVEVLQFYNGSRELWITLPDSRESPTFKANADDSTLELLTKESIAYRTLVQGRDFGFRAPDPGEAVVYIVLLMVGAAGLLWFAKWGLAWSTKGSLV